MRSNQHSIKHFDMTSAQRVATHIPQASRILIVAAVLGSALCFSLSFGFPNSSSPAAFTGAQGGGAASRGGRGGEICEVTNLNDSGPNSARDCLTRRNPRTVIFRVAGRINLHSGIRINDPYLTIAGQTAPGGGIEFAGKEMNNDSLIFIYTHDVVVRNVRVRVGNGPGHSPGPGTGCVGFYIGNADVFNVILDHISVSWSDNKPVGLWSNYGPGVRNVTVQWSMINESILGHAVGPGVGNSNGSTANFLDDDFHHNFLSNASHRLPETAQRSMRWVNNIVYNWSFYASATLGAQVSDFIGNIYKAGPLNHEAQKYELHFSDVGSPWDSGPPSVYLLGNKGPNQQNPSGDQWVMANKITGENGKEIGPVPQNWRRSVPLPAEEFPITADDANHLEDILFATVGDAQRLDCDGNWVNKRDPVDIRLIAEYKNGKGILPRSEDAVGGFPKIDPGQPCVDTDHDGIPDAWEIAHKLNPKNPADAGKITADGYTALEHYLNGNKPQN
jgi:pectate lyase